MKVISVQYEQLLSLQPERNSPPVLRIPKFDYGTQHLGHYCRHFPAILTGFVRWHSQPTEAELSLVLWTIQYGCLIFLQEPLFKHFQVTWVPSGQSSFRKLAIACFL